MITLFESFKKKQIQRKPKLGDYVILHDEEENIYWNNFYGKVIDIGKFRYKEDYTLCLVELMNEINEDDIFNLEIGMENTSGIDSKYKALDTSWNSGWDKNHPCIWVNSDYVIKFNTKEEFDKEVEKIEINKSANKYNL